MLAPIPTRSEFAGFTQVCLAQDHAAENVSLERLPAARFRDPGLPSPAVSWSRRSSRYIPASDRCRPLEPAECAGVGGALVDHLAAGSVVAITETVEHNIRHRFGPPLLPRLTGSAPYLEAYSRLDQLA